MRIEFSWPPGRSELSAETLAGKISAGYSGLCIRPGKGYRKEWETLILEVPSLSAPYVYANLPGSIPGWLHETDHCAVIAQIEEKLAGYGVVSEVRICGFAVRQYAAQQESLAHRRKQAMEDAIIMLKKTRKLFGKKIFEDVRRRLEKDLADPIYY